MSAIGAAVGGIPADELSAIQRVQQLQALIESSRQVWSAAPAAGASFAPAQAAPAQSSATDFASALQAATGADDAALDEPAALSSSLGLGAPQGAGEGGEYEALVAQAAARNGVEPAVLHGLIEQESGFDPSASSSAGAEGLTQLMPGTAASLGVANPMDPAEAIEGGARYLGELTRQFGGDTTEALAAYNAGPGAVEQYGGVPPYAETEGYVSKVLGYAEAYRQAHPADGAEGVPA